MRKVYLSSFIFVLGLISLNANAQTYDTSAYKPILPLYRDVIGDTTVISKKNMPQEKLFQKGQYIFPAKPKNKWEIGLNGGLLFISGDVATRGGWGAGLQVRKSLGYAVSIKGEVLHGNTKGLNWQASTGLANNPVLAKPATSYYNNEGVFYYNYSTTIDEANLQLVLTINNIGYHKVSKERKVNIYGGIGGGGMYYQCNMDALDANDARYDFASVNNQNYTDRKIALTQLKGMLDGTYETASEGQPDQPQFFDRVFKPVITGSMGIGFHLSRRMQFTLSEKISIVNDDLLDGQRWQEHPYSDPVLTGNFDTYHFISGSLGFFIGGHKRVEPLYWQNPSDYTYDAIQSLLKKNVDDLVDTDDDGVVNRLDDEPNSLPNAIVDTHGVTVDNDKDGIDDAKDKDPYSPIGATVDSDGVPTDGDGDGVPDFRDKEPNTNPIGLVDVNGKTILPGGGGAGGYWWLPMIFYDLDKDVIKPEMYERMKYVATVMKMYPDLKIVAIGNTDIRASNAYNEDLSTRRVNNARKFLVDTYGIDGNRIITKHAGETDNLVKGLPDGYNAKYEGQQYYNRRVEFKVYDAKTDK